MRTINGLLGFEHNSRTANVKSHRCQTGIYSLAPLVAGGASEADLRLLLHATLPPLTRVQPFLGDHGPVAWLLAFPVDGLECHCGGRAPRASAARAGHSRAPAANGDQGRRPRARDRHDVGAATHPRWPSAYRKAAMIPTYVYPIASDMITPSAEYARKSSRLRLMTPT
jgi:hypothetical protein